MRLRADGEVALIAEHVGCIVGGACQSCFVPDRAIRGRRLLVHLPRTGKIALIVKCIRHAVRSASFAGPVARRRRNLFAFLTDRHRALGIAQVARRRALELKRLRDQQTRSLLTGFVSQLRQPELPDA